MCAAAGWSPGHLDPEEVLTEQRWEQQADSSLSVPAHPVMQRRLLHLGPSPPGLNIFWAEQYVDGVDNEITVGGHTGT